MLAPFDWTLANENNFRAFVNEDGKSVDFSVGSGRSGRIARRLFRFPAPFRLEIPVSGLAESSGSQLDAAVTCASDGRILAEAALSNGTNVLAVPAAGSCRYFQIDIDVSADLLDPRINATIGNIQIR